MIYYPLLDYTMVSLSGKDSCAGHVRIRHGDKTYRLSGSNSTWNWDSANAVCRQLHCGNASKYSSSPSTKNDVWRISYNCTSDKHSLFHCDNVTLAADHGSSTAHVTCTGRKTLKMTIMGICAHLVSLLSDAVDDNFLPVLLPSLQETSR